MTQLEEALHSALLEDLTLIELGLLAHSSFRVLSWGANCSEYSTAFLAMGHPLMADFKIDRFCVVDYRTTTTDLTGEAGRAWALEQALALASREGYDIIRCRDTGALWCTLTRQPLNK